MLIVVFSYQFNTFKEVNLTQYTLHLNEYLHKWVSLEHVL